VNGFTPRAAGRGRKTRLALIGAATAASLAAFAAPASATTTSCDLVASPTGSDSATGTVGAPFRSAQKLASSLSEGQTGCFRAGSYAGNNQIKVSTPGVTLTSYPGERAELVGRLWVAQEAPGVTITGLDLNGRNSTNLPSPTINADDVDLTDNDITNDHTAICVSLGSLDTWGRADRTLIENNRIHDCGGLPASNYDHGIYVAAADDTVIRGNVIVDNADRGIQLYPDAQGTRVVGNIIDGNGSGVIISGAGDNASSGNVIEHNVITNSRIRDNVESYWEGNIGTNNIVRNNCIGGGAYDDGDGGILSGGNVGFTASNNLITVPNYANRAAGDYTLPAGSPCAAILAGAATSAVTDPVTDPVAVSPEPTTSEPVVTSPAPTETSTPATSTQSTSTTAPATTTTPATSDAPISTTTSTTTKAGRAHKQSGRRAHRGHRGSRRGHH
jgi:nitrous oxidase accessory protein NosD